MGFIQDRISSFFPHSIWIKKLLMFQLLLYPHTYDGTLNLLYSLVPNREALI